MKTLYFDCQMGAAGDMLTAALYELLDDEGRKEFLDKINNAGIQGVTSTAEPSVKCGITGTHMKVLVDGMEEQDHHHHHDHKEEHHHDHADMHGIEHIIDDLKIPGSVKEDAKQVYGLIAEAESHAHGKPVTDIHFHEVGTKDAVADVVSVCLLMDMLRPDRVMSSPVNVGSGHVHCAHGVLPVPAPATAYILRDVPIYQGHVKSELCTPTGAALLKHFTDEFTDMPIIRIESTGYGMGRKDFEQANCVRAFLGESLGDAGRVTEFKCTLDDMTPEMIGFAEEVLFREGALEVYTLSAGMKKSRPGIELNVMCKEADRDKILKLIFKHTTTLGIREYTSRRYTLDRRIEERDTEYGKVRLKISEGYGVKRQKWEYEDISRAARERGCSVEEIITGLGNNAEDR
ncbi:MAG: nickel pincer cofactor biosynthesis protein LarC [Saccharofermentans sp.]|nr:nickel pincer cofactor biosynthesis protein LarC [Saccharofermentans sp.]